MPTTDKILEQMDDLLDRLILTAEKLRDISNQVIEKEELKSLQQIQEQQVKELVALDEKYHHALKDNAGKKNVPLRARIDKKLEKFEKLNAQFIENIHDSRSLLNFNAVAKTRKNQP